MIPPKQVGWATRLPMPSMSPTRELKVCGPFISLGRFMVGLHEQNHFSRYPLWTRLPLMVAYDNAVGIDL